MNGSEWAPAIDVDTKNAGTVTSIAAGSGLTGGTITGSGTLALASTLPAVDGGALTNVNAVKLQTIAIDPMAPAASQVLKLPSKANTALQRQGMIKKCVNRQLSRSPASHRWRIREDSLHVPSTGFDTTA